MNTDLRKTKIKELIVNRLNLEMDPADIQDDSQLFFEGEGGLGLDSVDALELAVALTNEFNVSITDEDMGIFMSVNTIDSFLERQLQSV